ncbi:MAG: phosphotransferase [Streptosporangiaceae bacterium]
MSEGELLTGDGVTQGIVRIGDTVRRPLRPFSLTVQAYLAHLRDAGFTGAPLPFGVDEQGREMLSFVPGDVPRNPLPRETAGDDVLVALARLIRTLHESSAGWAPPSDAVWGGTPASVGRPTGERTELVSHCDYYPGNVVFRDGLPAALIDFDLAHPTTRLHDIANALWYWAPLRDPRDRVPAFADADIPRRVAVFADAYGMTARHRAELAPFAVDMARRYHEDSRASAELDPVFRKLWQDGAKDELPRAKAWLREVPRRSPLALASRARPTPNLAPRVRRHRLPGPHRQARRRDPGAGPPRRPGRHHPRPADPPAREPPSTAGWQTIAARSLSRPIRAIRSHSPALLVAAQAFPVWRDRAALGRQGGERGLDPLAEGLVGEVGGEERDIVHDDRHERVLGRGGVVALLAAQGVGAGLHDGDRQPGWSPRA